MSIRTILLVVLLKIRVLYNVFLFIDPSYHFIIILKCFSFLLLKIYNSFLNLYVKFT